MRADINREIEQLRSDIRGLRMLPLVRSLDSDAREKNDFGQILVLQNKMDDICRSIFQKKF